MQKKSEISGICRNESQIAVIFLGFSPHNSFFLSYSLVFSQMLTFWAAAYALTRIVRNILAKSEAESTASEASSPYRKSRQTDSENSSKSER